MKRIINIDNDVVGFFDEGIIELEFYSIRNYLFVKNKGRFVLSNRVIKKYYVPNVPRLGVINSFFRFFVILYLFFRYKPSLFLEEWSLPKGIKLLKYLFKKCKIGLDIHGAAPEEFYYLHKKPSRMLIRQERYSVFAADFIICQSDEMRRHLEHKYGITEGITVYRCGVDINIFKVDSVLRSTVRDSLGVSDDDLVFVYSGGMHSWQKVYDSAQIFVKYHSLNEHSVFLILTKEVSLCKRILFEAGGDSLLNSSFIVSLPFDEVPKYLNAADVAFLIRDDDIMNAVASPTKLAEYFACGLPIISSRVSKKWISGEGQRFVFDADNLNYACLFESIHCINKQQISDFSSKELSLEIDRENVQQFLSSYL
ncbi:MAG: glycosyltransferase [Paludibacteraceae bacterium]|nr:glycosyltransferase [Paludibacteraceae bacterium]